MNPCASVVQDVWAGAETATGQTPFGVESTAKLTYPSLMQRSTLAVLVAAVAAVLLGAGFGDGTVYNGPATRAAAQLDPRAHITAPAKTDAVMGRPTTRFAFELSRNTGEFAVYRSHVAAVKALAQGEELAKAFGQSLKELAAVHANVIIGFDKRPTSSQRTETQGWLRSR